jgi:hypothetical protein
LFHLGEEESNDAAVGYSTVLKNGILSHLHLGQYQSCMIRHYRIIDSNASRGGIMTGQPAVGNNWTVVRCNFQEKQNSDPSFFGWEDAAIFYVYPCRFSLDAPTYAGIATLVGFVSASFITYYRSWNVYTTFPIYNFKMQTQTPTQTQTFPFSQRHRSVHHHRSFHRHLGSDPSVGALRRMQVKKTRPLPSSVWAEA